MLGTGGGAAGTACPVSPSREDRTPAAPNGLVLRPPPVTAPFTNEGLEAPESATNGKLIFSNANGSGFQPYKVALQLKKERKNLHVLGPI